MIKSFLFTSVSVIEVIIGHTSKRPLLEEVVLKCEGDSLSEQEIDWFIDWLYKLSILFCSILIIDLFAEFMTDLLIDRWINLK